MNEESQDANTYTLECEFGWEEDEQGLEELKNKIQHTKILVVIGYSFPYFNRQVDRAIIKAMTNLEKVYFQAESEEATIKMVESFKAIEDPAKTIKKECINDANQFFIPYEL